MINTSQGIGGCPKCGDSQFMAPLLEVGSLIRLKCNNCGAEYYPCRDNNGNPINILDKDLEDFLKGKDNG